MFGVSVERVQNSEFGIQGKKTVRSYRDLLVWQKAMQLVTDVYVLTKSFPKEELYGLTQQIRRCAVSVPSNIAEGGSKRSTRDYVRFLNIAYGSLSELETQLLIALNLGYSEAEKIQTLLEYASEIGKMLNALINKLEEKIIP